MTWAAIITLGLASLVSLRCAVKRPPPVSDEAYQFAKITAPIWFGALAYALWERLP